MLDIAGKDEIFMVRWIPMKKEPEIAKAEHQYFVEEDGVINHLLGSRSASFPPGELKLRSFKFGGGSLQDQLRRSSKTRLHPALTRFANEIARTGATTSQGTKYAFNFWFNVSSQKNEAYYNLCTHESWIMAIVFCQRFDSETVENVVSLDHELYRLLVKCKVPSVKQQWASRLVSLITEVCNDLVGTRVVKLDYKKWRKPLKLTTCHCGGFELALGFMIMIVHRETRFLEIGKWVFDLGPDK